MLKILLNAFILEERLTILQEVVFSSKCVPILMITALLAYIETTVDF